MYIKKEHRTGRTEKKRERRERGYRYVTIMLH